MNDTQKDLTEHIALFRHRLIARLLPSDLTPEQRQQEVGRIVAEDCPSLETKRITPHVLRHTAAIMVLQATGDIRKVSLWFGHTEIQTTEAYLRADPTEKLDVMSAVVPPILKRGHFSAPDKLIATLHGD